MIQSKRIKLLRNILISILLVIALYITYFFSTKVCVENTRKHPIPPGETDIVGICLTYDIDVCPGFRLFFPASTYYVNKSDYDRLLLILKEQEIDIEDYR